MLSAQGTLLALDIVPPISLSASQEQGDYEKHAPSVRRVFTPVVGYARLLAFVGVQGSPLFAYWVDSAIVSGQRPLGVPFHWQPSPA